MTPLASGTQYWLFWLYNYITNAALMEMDNCYKKQICPELCWEGNTETRARIHKDF